MLHEQDISAASMSQSLQTIINNREDIPVAAVVGADADSVVAGGCLAGLGAAHKACLFRNMLQEVYFAGEELFVELDSMSPLFYLVEGSVRIADGNRDICYKHRGMLLSGDVLDIAAGRCLHTCIPAYTTYIHTYVRTCMHACIHAYLHILNPYVYTHTHTHTH